MSHDIVVASIDGNIVILRPKCRGVEADPKEEQNSLLRLATPCCVTAIASTEVPEPGVAGWIQEPSL
jgi:hypothetical protein